MLEIVCRRSVCWVWKSGKEHGSFRSCGRRFAKSVSVVGTHPTSRLETRTKESIICASRFPGMEGGGMKVMGAKHAQHLPILVPPGLKDLSRSINGGTRKMVNYA